MEIEKDLSGKTQKYKIKTVFLYVVLFIITCLCSGCGSAGIDVETNLPKDTELHFLITCEPEKVILYSESEIVNYNEDGFYCADIWLNSASVKKDNSYINQKWSDNEEQTANGESGNEEQTANGESGNEEQTANGESGNEEQTANGESGNEEQITGEETDTIGNRTDTESIEAGLTADENLLSDDNVDVADENRDEMQYDTQADYNENLQSDILNEEEADFAASNLTGKQTYTLMFAYSVSKDELRKYVKKYKNIRLAVTDKEGNILKMSPTFSLVLKKRNYFWGRIEYNYELNEITGSAAFSIDDTRYKRMLIWTLISSGNAFFIMISLLNKKKVNRREVLLGWGIPSVIMLYMQIEQTFFPYYRELDWTLKEGLIWMLFYNIMFWWLFNSIIILYLLFRKYKYCVRTVKKERETKVKLPDCGNSCYTKIISISITYRYRKFHDRKLHYYVYKLGKNYEKRLGDIIEFVANQHEFVKEYGEASVSDKAAMINDFSKPVIYLESEEKGTVTYYAGYYMMEFEFDRLFDRFYNFRMKNCFF